MYYIVKFISILFLTISLADTARILCVYPAPFHSHEVVLLTLTEELARQGHELVVLAPITINKNIPNVTLIDVKNMSYTMWEDLSIQYPVKLNTINVDPESFWNMLDYNMYPILEAQFKVPEMNNIIKNKDEKFDLILIEGCIRPSLMISARFKAPVIIVSTFYGTADNYYTVGATVDPIIFPDFNLMQTWNSGLMDKLSSVYTSLRLRLREWKMEKSDNAMIKNLFGKKAPEMAELRKNVQMLLLNVHHVWDYNRPVPPNVLYLGALHLKSPKPLNKDLKKYLDSSKNGVIFMSLGSKLRSSDLPQQTVNLILRVFATLPYDFIWKWDAETPTEKPINVHFQKWLPQTDLLYHPKVKAFITHAGLQSTDEAIAARVPLISLPVRSDQFSNAAKYEQFGIGVKLNMDYLEEEDFKKTIIDVAENPRYRKNLDNLARIMKEERHGALEKAIRWINHIAAHGGQELRPPLPDLSFIEYYLIDVIVAIALIVFIPVTILIIGLKRIIRLVNEIYTSNQKLKMQ